ncbi:MAG TPA: hypothetical protein VK985_05215 [Rariglobus sp.]|nr:hypothetical protein [Rariglobus sp.]
MNTQPYPRVVSFPAYFIALMTVLAAAVTAPTARASLLVYEGFNYGVANNTLLNTIDTSTSLAAPNGLQGNYGEGTPSVRYNTTGLSLGSLPISGGKTLLGNASGVAGVKVAGSTAAVTGDLFMSYVFNYTGTLSTNAFTVGVNTSAITAANTAGRYFNVEAISADAGSTTAISYGNSYGTPANSGETLVAGTTYLMVAQFTNVGTALSVENPGVATLWVLTAAQYNSFLSTGFSAAALNEASIGATATNVYSRVTASQSSGTFDFNGSSTVQYVFSSANSVIENFDELRIGTTLNDVLGIAAIPEPSTLTLSLGAAGLIFAGSRRFLARR